MNVNNNININISQKKTYYYIQFKRITRKIYNKKHKFEMFRTIRDNFRFPNETLNNLLPRIKTRIKTRLHLQITIHELS